MARIWTDAQKKAIESRNGTILVSAAAGSGKTAVLVERVIQRIVDTDNPVDIEKLLIVTFTKAAAAEMKERISKRLSELIHEQPKNQYLKRQKMYLPNAQISTMDSFCARLIRENFEKADVAPDFSMLSDIEHDMLKQEIISEVLEELYSRPESETEAFLRLFSNGRNDRNLIDSVLSLYNFAMASQNPLNWLEMTFSDYFDNLSISESKWGKYCLERLLEILEYIKIKANGIINDAPENSNLAGAIANDLAPILLTIDNIIELINNHPEKWDEIKQLTESLKFGTFPRIPKDEKDCNYEDIKGRRDSIKKYLASANSILICTESEFKDDIEYLRPIMKIFKDCTVSFIEKLNAYKKENNTYYFSDILHFALKILVEFKSDGTYEKTPLANELSENFAEILIDEFQDTNEAQDTLFSVISKNDGNKFMVGDVKQSIYRFRQAMPEIFMGYKDSFNIYTDGNYPAVINLDRNFRSRKGILDGINHIFRYLMNRKTCGIDYEKGEQLEFGGNYPTEDSTDVNIHIVESDNPRGNDLVAEARHIGNVINDLVSSKALVGKKGEERPIRYSDICILLRAVKDKANVISKELTEMGIPVYFQKQGGFFESKEIVTLISMLKVIDNPVQDVPLAAVMLSPLFSFTEDDLAYYRVKNRNGNFYDAVKNQYDEDIKAKQFIDLLSHLRMLSVTMDIGSLIRRVLEITSYDSIVGAMENGEKRVLNIELLISYAENYEKSSSSGLSGFIRYLDKIRKYEKDLDGANDISENDDVVRIMSIHKSKGLEFPVVFIANCSSSTHITDVSKVKVNRKLGIAASRYFPDLHKDFSTLQSNAIKICEKAEEAAEHIRVLYVAMTRAEEKLYLVGSMYNPEKKITDLYYECYDKSKENSVPVSMCSSYMQWILLSMMNHPSLNLNALINVNKDSDVADMSFGIFPKCENTAMISEKEPEFKCDNEMLKIVTERLAYQYPFTALSDVPVKYAASSVNSDENLKYLASENPAFSGTGELTPAQRGTLIHKFMEVCDLDSAYKNLEEEIASVVNNRIFTEKEAKSLNVKAIKSFFASDLYKRISSAESYVREKEFSMSLPVSLINSDLPESVQNETVIVQGVIDGLVINGDSCEIVDYKTDRVESEEELCERYKEQMRIYKKAAEECFGMQNVAITLYSFHLSKEISLKL